MGSAYPYHGIRKHLSSANRHLKSGSGGRRGDSVLKPLIELLLHPRAIVVLFDQRLRFIQVSDDFSFHSLRGSLIMSLVRQLGWREEKGQTCAVFLFLLIWSNSFQGIKKMVIIHHHYHLHHHLHHHHHDRSSHLMSSHPGSGPTLSSALHTYCFLLHVMLQHRLYFYFTGKQNVTWY